MHFDPDNPVNKLCVEGLGCEGRGDTAAANRAYRRAWDLAGTALEKLTAAHYLARTQPGITGKLRWDQAALDLALSLTETPAQALLPSLYLNTGKCHEDLGDLEAANANYTQALQHAPSLPADGYGSMIRSGIEAALRRVKRPPGT